MIACGDKKPPKPPEAPPLSASAYSHYVRGRLAAIEGDTDEAAREFGLAAQAAPDEPEIVAAYIRALTQAKREDDAVVVATKATNRWPKRADINLAAGRALRKVRDYPRAIAALERARALDPELEEASLELALALVAESRPERAVEIYRDLANSQPQEARPLLRFARLLIETARYAEAIAALEKLFETAPDHIKARSLHGRALVALGKHEAALETLHRAYVLSERRPRIAQRLFNQLMEEGEHRLAARFANRLGKPANHILEQVLAGRFLMRLGYSAPALKIGERLRKADPDNSEAVLLSAFAAAQRRQFGHAVRAIRSVPLTVESREWCAEWLVLAGQTTEARKLLDQLDAADPQRVIVGARIDELSGNPGDARVALNAARSQWPDDYYVSMALASLELRSGNGKVAADIAQQLLEGDENDSTLSNFVGFSLADAGIELDRASKLLAVSRRARPDDANVLDSYGWLLFRRRKYEEAGQALRRAWRLAPAEAEILFHLAHVEEKLGRTAAAKRRLQEALPLAIEPSLRLRIETQLTRW